MNAKVFSLMPKVNETKFLVHYESCECKCRFNVIIFQCKYKELND